VPDWFAPLPLLLDALAVTYIVYLITTDGGPLSPIRERMLDRMPGLLVKWASCPWCASAWVGAAVLALHALLPAIWPYAAAMLATAAIASILVMAIWRLQRED